MGRFYSSLLALGPIIADGNAAWSDLGILQKPSAGLGPAEIARLRGRLDSVGMMEYIVTLISYRMLKLSDRLGIARPQPHKVFTERFCTVSDHECLPALLKAEMQP
jgi:hypothetical protein